MQGKPLSVADIPPRSRWLRRVPFFLMLAAALFGAVALRDTLGFEAIARHREALLAFRDAHYLGAVLAFLAAYVAIVALSLPGGTVATLVGGFMFGLFPGVVFNVLAAGTGAVAVFMAARAGLGDATARRIASSGGRVARLQAQLRENEWSVLLLMRLVPVVPFFLANLIPAFVGTSLWRFGVTTFVGIIPGALVFTSVGSGLGEVLARGETPEPGILLSPPVLLPLLGLAALAALPMLLRALRGRPE